MAKELISISTAAALTGLTRQGVHIILKRYPEIPREEVENPFVAAGKVIMLPESSLQMLRDKDVKKKIKKSRE